MVQRSSETGDRGRWRMREGMVLCDMERWGGGQGRVQDKGLDFKYSVGSH